jgi:hypothetical protein
MRPRQLTLLAIATAAAAALAGWTWYDSGGRDTDASVAGELMFPALAAEGSDLDRIEITAPGYRLALEYRDGAWVAPEHGDFPVDAAAAARLVTDFAGLRIWEAKTTRPDLYSRIGVEDAGDGAPSERVRFVGADGAALADAIVGLRSRLLAGFPRGGTFVRVPGDPQAWLVQGTVTVPNSLGEWIGPLLQIPGPTVQRIALFDGDRELLSAARNEDVYQLASADPAVAAPADQLDDAAMKSMTRGIVAVRPIDVKPIEAVDFAGDGRSVAFETDSGLTLRVRLGDLDGQTWLALEARASAETAEAQATEINARTANWAFLLEPQGTETFTVSPDQLIAAPPGNGGG